MNFRESQSLLVALCLLGGNLGAYGQTLTFNPDPAELSQAKSELWLPENVAKAEGLLVIAEYAVGRQLYEDPRWRTFAADNLLGLLLHNFRERSGRKTLAKDAPALKSLDAHLRQHAETTSRPEVAIVPRTYIRLSQAGSQAFDFAKPSPKPSPSPSPKPSPSPSTDRKRLSRWCESTLPWPRSNRGSRTTRLTPGSPRSRCFIWSAGRTTSEARTGNRSRAAEFSCGSSSARPRKEVPVDGGPRTRGRTQRSWVAGVHVRLVAGGDRRSPGLNIGFIPLRQ